MLTQTSLFLVHILNITVSITDVYATNMKCEVDGLITGLIQLSQVKSSQVTFIYSGGQNCLNTWHI